MRQQLTPTARVILGMLRLGPRTGYEIKQLVDVSTRFFWAASYGQIYPELRRLEAAGLVVGEADATSGRRRREYRLTKEGDRALDAWLAAGDDLIYELRDEGVLKLFFSDSLPAPARVDLVRSMRVRHEEILARLGTIEAPASEAGGGPYRTLRYGLRFHRLHVDLLAELERELQGEAGVEEAA